MECSRACGRVALIRASRATCGRQVSELAAAREADAKAYLAMRSAGDAPPDPSPYRGGRYSLSFVEFDTEAADVAKF